VGRPPLSFRPTLVRGRPCYYALLGLPATELPSTLRPRAPSTVEAPEGPARGVSRWSVSEGQGALASPASLSTRSRVTVGRLSCRPHSVENELRAVGSTGRTEGGPEPETAHTQPLRRGGGHLLGAFPGPCCVRFRRSCLEGRWGRPGKTAVSTASLRVYRPSPACQGESQDRCLATSAGHRRYAVNGSDSGQKGV
jgi:hypothetical protein